MKTVHTRPGDGGAAIRDGILNGLSFRVDRTHLTFRPGAPDSFGDLPEPFRSEVQKLSSAGKISWTAYSYETPIAWRVRLHSPADTGGRLWRMPNVNYSLTTSTHQAAVRSALSPVVYGPRVSLREGNGTGVGSYGPRRGGIDG